MHHRAKVLQCPNLHKTFPRHTNTTDAERHQGFWKVPLTMVTLALKNVRIRVLRYIHFLEG